MISPYLSGAQRPASGQNLARDESSCGPRCLITKVTIVSSVILFTVAEFEFKKMARAIN